MAYILLSSKRFDYNNANGKILGYLPKKSVKTERLSHYSK